jgi:hypothetical protein
VTRSLYGQCVFSSKTAANTALADEVLAAAKTPLFAANVLKLQADFNATLLAYETTYWNLTAAGGHLSAAVLSKLLNKSGGKGNTYHSSAPAQDESCPLMCTRVPLYCWLDKPV